MSLEDFLALPESEPPSEFGDGAIVALLEEAYQVIFWPQSGEYVNTTNFVTDQEFERHFEFRGGWYRGTETDLRTRASDPAFNGPV